MSGVLRGASWNNKPSRLRSANRNRNDPTNRNNNIGFRLAEVLPGALGSEPERARGIGGGVSWRSIAAVASGQGWPLEQCCQG